MANKSSASSLKKKRRMFGWLFLFSIIVLCASTFLLTHNIKRAAHPISSRPNGQSTPTTQTSNLPMVVSVVSLLTSITSLIGFLSTTVLAWRKEKREVLESELEIRKKELELEKLRAELNKSGKR